MKTSALKLLAIAALALAAAGCVQSRLETVIAGDGSGTMSLSYSLSPEVAAAMKDLAAMPGQGEGQDELPSLDDFDRAKIEAACAAHGVKVKKLERAQAEGRETMTMELSFPSLDALSASLGESGSLTSGLRIVDAGDGNLKLVGVKLAEKPEAPEEPETEAEAETPAGEMDAAAMQKGLEAMGKLMAAAAELNVVMRVTVPGDIVSHNAMRVEGRTAIWELNSANMMTAGQSLGEPEIVFSGKGLALKAAAQ